jgi:hypothetical protein
MNLNYPKFGLLPEALYPCVHCKDDYSWPAEDLCWSGKLQGWVCANRWDVDEHGDPGLTLSKAINEALFDRIKEAGREAKAGIEEIHAALMQDIENAAQESLRMALTAQALHFRKEVLLGGMSLQEYDRTYLNDLREDELKLAAELGIEISEPED